MRFQTEKLVLYGIIAASLFMGDFVPQLNVLISAGMASWILYKKRLDLLPLLLLTNLPVTAFNVDWSAYRTYGAMVETYEKAYINFGGLPISAGLVTTLVMAGVCILNFLKNPGRYYPGAMAGLFALWWVGAAMTFLIALNGILNGHQAWSGPLRAYLSLIGIFYGYSLALDRPHLKQVLFRDLLIFALVIGVLALPRMFYHRIMFLGASFFPVLAIGALRIRGPGSKLLGIVTLVVWGLYSVVVGSTLTLFALYALSTILGLVVFMGGAALRRLVGYACGGFMVLIITGYMLVAILGAKHFTVEQIGFSGADLSLKERIIFKVFDDRARLWGFVLDDIWRDNLIMPVPGEEMVVEHPKFGEVYVRHGAHNSYLQALRENGLIAGGIIIILMAFTLVACAKAYRDSKVGYTAALAAGVIPTLTVGAVTGHYVIGQTIGAFIFMLAGMAIARDQLPVPIRRHRHR